MSVALPTPTQLRSIAEQCGLSLTDEDVASFRGLMQGSLEAYNLVAAMPDELPVVKYPRTPGYRPSPEENPRNAWYRKSTVKGAASGKLKGKTVALKDNIMLAGVPIFYSHTPYTTLMRTTPAESAKIGRVTAERLSQARGPAAVLWPAKGVSDYDREGGVFRDADADGAWLQAVKDNLRPEIIVCELDCHINDPEFAEAAVTWLLKQLGQGGTSRADV